MPFNEDREKAMKEAYLDIRGRVAAATGGRLVVALLLVALVLLGATAPALAAAKIGRTSIIVKRVSGEVDENFRLLVLKDDVYSNELIEAAAASASEIVFLDDTKLSIGPYTRLTLDRFIYDPDKGTGTFVLSVVEGVFRLAAGRMARAAETAYVIHTPTATIGIRGTVVTSVVAPDGTNASNSQPSAQLAHNNHPDSSVAAQTTTPTAASSMAG